MNVPITSWMNFLPLLLRGDEVSSGLTCCTLAPQFRGTWGCGCCWGFVGFLCLMHLRAVSTYPGIDTWTSCVVCIPSLKWDWWIIFHQVKDIPDIVLPVRGSCNASEVMMCCTSSSLMYFTLKLSTTSANWAWCQCIMIVFMFSQQFFKVLNCKNFSLW